jgi:predicted RNA binding protein with dsRBD fold (UPF0201 family)
MVEIRLRTHCYPTEDRERVVGAMSSLFPDVQVSGREDLDGVSHSLEAFAEQLKKQRIRDTARAVLRRGLREDIVSFRLNKQVATVGNVSFSEEEHPLGDIEVEISAEDIAGLIDLIAPSTKAVGGR